MVIDHQWQHRCIYLQAVGVCLHRLLLQVAYKPVAKPWADDVCQPEHTHKRGCVDRKEGHESKYQHQKQELHLDLQ